MKEIHDGDRVRVALARSGMSHKDFAGAIGISPSSLSRRLNESSWRTDQLSIAGDRLGINFFQEYDKKVSGSRPALGIILKPECLRDPDLLKKIVSQINQEP